MDATTLQSELAELTEKLEELLHNKLPEAARLVRARSGDGRDLVPLVDELDELQRALGMKTYELLRTGAPLGRVEVSEVRQEFYPSDLQRWGAAESPTAVQPVDEASVVSRTCSANPCTRTSGVTPCARCKRPFCPDHNDPALHPCEGDQFE